MQLNIPDEIIQTELAKNITSLVLVEVEKRLKLLTKTVELPPYPSKREVKSILGIGDEMLKEWISNGLAVIPWSKKEDRIDRDDIREYINSMKISV